MGIVDEDVARVREATDIVGLIGERMALKRVGRRFSGLCPFHTEKTPSFSVNAEDGVWFCFGCQKGGDAITFVRELDGLTFVEAIERLAQRAGIALRYDTANQSRDHQRRARLTDAVQLAVDFYHRLLLEHPDAGRARGYLRSRGFDGDAARRFQLGYAPEGFDALARHLSDHTVTRDDIVAAGLGFVNRAQKVQDFFRGRLMFPVFDRAGSPVGFGGRTLTGDGPKYKNTPDSPLYHKSRLLYGLNWAKAEVGARDEIVICEGYTDVMGFALAGVPQAVATCGTALADEHVEIIKGFTHRIVLAYDADAAGQTAAEKWYQWEQRYDMQVRVAALPPGRDPGDLWRENPELLPKAVEAATSFLQFRIDRVLADADLTNPEGRARTAEALVPVLRQHPSELVREQYIQTVAGTLGIEHAWFKQAIARGPRTPPPAPGGARAKPATEVDRRELDALVWVMHEPELVADWIDASLFSDPIAREAFEILSGTETLPEAIERAEGPVRPVLERLAVLEPAEDDEPESVRARLLANMVIPAAERLKARFQCDHDERLGTLNAHLDATRSALGKGWEAGEPAAMQLVRLVAQWMPA